MELDIAILAAGQGKRMKSQLPKVLHPILFRPMIHHVLDVTQEIPHRNNYLIVGHGEAQVRESCLDYSKVEYIHQREQHGTAHAIRQLIPCLSGKRGMLLVLSGDVALLRKTTLKQLIETHETTKAAVTFLTTHLPDPSGYGRVLRKGKEVVGIREHADASLEERKITEVNTGIYCFDISSLLQVLDRIEPKNKQKEYYLTDAVGILGRDRKTVATQLALDYRETLGVNDREALSQAQKILQERVNRDYMLAGVSLVDPVSTYIDPHCKIGVDVTIEPGCVLIDSQIGEACHIEMNSRVVASVLAPFVTIKQGSYIHESSISSETSVGPYANLRPGTRLGEHVRIGNFVETKKATLADGAKASHLSYIGDADIGKNVNLGCGFITCNYDGKHKHKTRIEDDVFIGSDSQIVAPLTVGKGSYIASGSTITESVPPNSLALSRGKQITKPGYAKKYQDKT